MTRNPDADEQDTTADATHRDLAAGMQDAVGEAGTSRPAQPSASLRSEQSPERTSSGVSQTVSGDGNVAFSAGHVGGSIHVGSVGRSPSRSDRVPEERKVRESGSPIRILFLGSNPMDSVRLRLDTEVREIDRALTTAALGSRFELFQKWAVRTSELQMHLLRHRPHLLHFSGHGSPSSAIYFEGDDGRAQPVDGARLARLLGQFNNDLRCVVLNACYSEEQARAIAAQVDCVVGMSTAVMDQAAVRFSASFYQSLAFGCTVRAAFDLSCADISLGELGQQEVPRLVAFRRDPETISFVQPPRDLGNR